MAKTKRVRKNRYKKKDVPFFKRIKWRPLAIMLGRFIGAILFVVGLSLVFIFGHDMLVQCDYLKAKKVRVSGNIRLSAERIKKISGIFEGKNILAVNRELAREKLLSIGWIKNVDIGRDFPDGISIHVVENHPVAIADFGQYFLINRQGRVFMEATPSDFPDLPVIRGITYAEWHPGPEKTRAFSSVMDVIRLFEEDAGPFDSRNLKEIQFDPEIGITLLTNTDVEKILIGFDDYKLKINRLLRILALDEKTRRYFAFYKMDLRDPERIVAKPKPVKIIDTHDASAQPFALPKLHRLLTAHSLKKEVCGEEKG